MTGYQGGGDEPGWPAPPGHATQTGQLGQPVVKPGVGGSPGLPGLLARLGDRVMRRPEPRFGIVLAGVGMVMIVIGVIATGGDSAGDGGDGEVNRTVGVLLSMLVVGAGYLLLVRFRQGPLATAGVVAAALGVPMLLAFATVESDVDADPDVFVELPVSIDAIALLSLAAWLVSYLWLPATRGRLFFLALSAFTLWLYLLEKVEEGAGGYVLTLPFSLLAYSFSSSFDDSGPSLPDPGTVGGFSLVVGLLYYLAAALLDRQGRRGMAPPFLAAGLVATGIGIGHLADDLEPVGTGLVLIVLGTVLALYGAVRGRRFTAWTWGAGVGLGAMLILGDTFDDSSTGFGIAAMVVGAAVVVLAHLVVTWFAEPDEMAPGGSRFTPRRPGPPPGAWPAAASPAGPSGPGPAPWPPPAPAVPPAPPPPGAVPSGPPERVDTPAPQDTAPPVPPPPP